MAKANEYVVAILYRGMKHKYVTGTGEHHMAFWEDGKEAKRMSKSMAVDMSYGLALNGYGNVIILCTPYMDYRNEEVSENV